MQGGNGLATATAETRSGADIDAWRRAIRDDTFARYHYEMGRAMSRTGDSAAAAAAYERAIAISPSLCVSHAALIELLNGLGRGDEADAARQRGAAVRPDFMAAAFVEFGVEAYLEGDYDTAEQRFVLAKNTEPNDGEWSLWRELARAASGKDCRMSGPFPVLSAPRLLEIVEAYLDAGKALYAKGRPAEAKNILSRALELAPDHPETLGYMGLVLAYEKRNDEAIPLMRRAVASNAGLLDIQANLGITLQLSGNYEESISALERAVALKGDGGWLQGHLGCSLYLAGRHEEAFARLVQALQLSPEEFWIRTYLGIVHQAAGRIEEAVATQREALRRTPRSPWVIGCLGLALQAWGRSADNKACQRAALTLAPGEPWQCANYALALLEEGRKEEAARWARRAAAADPNSIWHQLNLRPIGQADLRDLYAKVGFVQPSR